MLILNDLMDTMIATWLTIPQILASVDGEAEAIYKFAPGLPEYPSYTTALDKLATPGMLLSHVATALGLRGGFPQWRHTFRLDFKVPAESSLDSIPYATVMKYLVDGIPANGEDLTIMNCQFADTVDSMEEVIFTTQVDTNGIVFYRMEFALQECTENLQD